MDILKLNSFVFLINGFRFNGLGQAGKSTQWRKEGWGDTYMESFFFHNYIAKESRESFFGGLLVVGYLSLSSCLSGLLLHLLNLEESAFFFWPYIHMVGSTHTHTHTHTWNLTTLPILILQLASLTIYMIYVCMYASIYVYIYVSIFCMHICI